MSCSIRRPPPASIGRSGSGSNADHPVPRRSPPRSVGSHARQRDSEDAPLSRSVPGRAEPIPAYRDQPGRATQAGTARSGARGLRTRHYSRRTEEAYVAWIRRYVLFLRKRHPAEMGAAEITRFLSSLAVHGRVAASTQNQALSALLFLYRDVWSWTCPGWTGAYGRSARNDCQWSSPAMRCEPCCSRSRGCRGSWHTCSTRGRARHPYRSGAAGAPRREHDPDLHARPEPGTGWGAESPRPNA